MIRLEVSPFRMGTGKEAALKPLEEAAEVYGAWQSIAEMAARLPKDVIDRYVIAKWNAHQTGKEAYKALKEEWKALVNLLIDNGGREMSEESLRAFLTANADRFPSFLKD